MYYQFDCKKCGACCKNITSIDKLNIFNDGSGVCKHLDKNNLCSIYSSRPDICNGEYVYSMYYKSNMSVEEFFDVAKQICNKLKSENNL